MSGWHYVTRNNEPPQELPKVYFCCHPADFQTHFLKTADLLLKNVRCAVWYVDADTPRDGDFYAMLSEMDLAVIPVTEKLLTEDSDAMRTDIPFLLATSFHGKAKSAIPLLPLVQSAAAEKVCQQHSLLKNIQYICAEQRGGAVSSYEEKLKAFLDRVLLNAELTEKVRGAFDAYIFFSYRKQDHRPVRALMDLIHSYPFCRDIALWYDEYLPTGEDFYRNIQEVLEKSALFVLSFTDSVLEDVDGHDNFVIREEIPAAYGRMQMLTVQTGTSADPSALATKLRPYLADADNSQIRQALCVVPNTDAAVRPALAKQLKRVSADKRKQNDRGPEHHYLMGLAYLHGVDTVKDAALAEELLELASQEGCVDASEQLVQMYRYGVGAKQNTARAIGIQERLIAQRRQRYIDDPCVDTWKCLFLAIMVCGHMQESQKDYTAAKATYQSALTFLESPSDYSELKLCLRNRLLCYSSLGDVSLAQDDYVYARDYYQMSINISHTLAQQVKGAVPQRDLYLSYLRLGDLCKAEGTESALDEAEVNYERGFELAFCITDPPDAAEWQQDMADFYTRLGDVCLKRKQYDRARGYFEKGLEHARLLQKCVDSIDAQLTLSICYERMGVVWYNGKRMLVIARDYFGKCVLFRREILTRFPAAEHRANLAFALYCLALTAPKNRAALLREALSLYDGLLSEDPENRNYRACRADCQRLLHQ